jgi:hypothetical protein
MKRGSRSHPGCADVDFRFRHDVTAKLSVDQLPVHPPLLSRAKLVT